MRKQAASALVALMCASASPKAVSAPREALQAHRVAAHQAPEHHLQEARRALERAWRKATPAERERLGPVRTHFAELVLAYTKIPKSPKDIESGATAQPSVATTVQQNQMPETPPRAEPTGATPGGPPRTSGGIPPPAASTKPPLDWQLKYAVVGDDLKGLGSDQQNQALRTRIDHFKSHLAMFYTAALGTPPR